MPTIFYIILKLIGFLKFPAYKNIFCFFKVLVPISDSLKVILLPVGTSASLMNLIFYASC